MVIKEFYSTRKDGVNLFKTYSDENLKIQKVGTDEIYSEAIDVDNSGFKYVETDMLIEDYLEITQTIPSSVNQAYIVTNH